MALIRRPLYGAPERQYKAYLTIEMEIPVRATDDDEAYDMAEDDIYERLNGIEITDCRGWASEDIN